MNNQNLKISHLLWYNMQTGPVKQLAVLGEEGRKHLLKTMVCGSSVCDLSIQ